MKLEEILELTRAGYSKEEIEALQNDSLLENPSVESAKQPDKDSEAEKETASESESGTSAADEIAKAMQEISKRIDSEISSLKKAYQEYNISQANNKVETAAGVDEIIGTIINPPFAKEKGE